MRIDVVRMYKDIHTWVGIVSGLALFIAFYAGAITMFERPLQRWASPPSALPPAVALEDAPRLIEATLAAHPEAARDYQINISPTPEAPARMAWHVPGPSGERGDEIGFASALTPQGELVVVEDTPAPVAQLVDLLHQQVGLPFDHEIAMPIMGAVCLLYAVALVSGVIVLLPSLSKDLFALRAGKNLKRMWLDVHNALGVFSLPFHIVMALTAVVFAFHDQFYDTQDVAVYQRGLEDIWAADVPAKPQLAPGARLLPPAEVVARLADQAPGFAPRHISYRTGPDGIAVARVEGEDLRYGHRGPDFGFAVLDPYTGELVDTEYMPGRQTGWMAVVTGFFALHFGNFGGAPVRWGYFALGLAGAFLFYSGNLLWVETRRKRLRRDGAEVTQSRSTRILGALTVGGSLGCVAGSSATIAAAKWLPGQVQDLPAWHMGIYYAVFLAAVGWALARGAARAGVELLCVCAGATALIPLTSLAGALRLAPGVWNHAGPGVLSDVTAAVAAGVFLLLARLAARRGRFGAPDSVGSFAAAPPPAGVAAERA